MPRCPPARVTFIRLDQDRQTVLGKEDMPVGPVQALYQLGIVERRAGHVVNDGYDTHLLVISSSYHSQFVELVNVFRAYGLAFLAGRSKTNSVAIFTPYLSLPIAMILRARSGQSFSQTFASEQRNEVKQPVARSRWLVATTRRRDDQLPATGYRLQAAFRGVSSTAKLPVSKTGLGGSNPSAPAKEPGNGDQGAATAPKRAKRA